jgi:hypothetical protein
MTHIQTLVYIIVSIYWRIHEINKKAVNVQKTVCSHPILAFFALVLEIDHFHENPKIIAGTPHVNMPTKLYLTGD